MQSNATSLLARLQHGRICTARVAARPIRLHTRGKATSTTAKPSSKLAVQSDTANKLIEMGAWKVTTGVRKKAGAVRAIEPRRVNITSESLCGMLYIYSFP